MREGRNGAWESKLRTNEISLEVGVRALERAGGIAVISGERERSQDFECAAHIPSVEVEIPGSKRGSATGDDTGTLWSLREGDGRAHEGVTAKNLDALSVGGHCE